MHAGEIQRAYGYRDLTDPAAHEDLLAWLGARTALAAERPGVLFDLATARLVDAKVLLPGATVLARLVSSVRDQALTALWETLAALPDPKQRRRLAGLRRLLPSSAGAWCSTPTRRPDPRPRLGARDLGMLDHRHPLRPLPTPWRTAASRCVT